MDKNIIKQYLAKTFLSEEVVPGISVTNAVKKKSAKANKDGVKDIEKKVGEFEKAVKKDINTKQMPPNKYNYTDDAEKTYHDEIEIMNGQEMVSYDRKPDSRFAERALEAIEGSSNMGNNPEWANVIPAQQGFTGPTFGKELVKKIKDSNKKRVEAEDNFTSLGDDIETIEGKSKKGPMIKGRYSALSESTEVKEAAGVDKNYTHFAIDKQTNKIVNGWDYMNLYDKAEKKFDVDSVKEYSKLDLIDTFPERKPSEFKIVTKKALERDGINPLDTNNWNKLSENPSSMGENKDNNKTQIKESMKRLKFKNPFNGVGNALRLIPEGYKVDSKVFEMTDGNETYKIRWEGNLSEGKAVVLTAADKTLVNEDITRMKQLFGYKSQDTLGLVKGNARIDENKAFGDIWSKTKALMTETEDMEGLKKPSEGEWEEETKSAPEATKHVEGSVKKDAAIAKAKEGNPEKAVKQAAEAKSHISSGSAKLTDKPKKGNWEDVKGGEKMMDTVADKPKEGNWEDADVSQAPEAKKHIHLKERKEEQEEGWMKNEEKEEDKVMDETFDIDSAEYMKEEFPHAYTDDAENSTSNDAAVSGAMDSMSDEEETEEPADDSNWAKTDDDDSDEKEPEVSDVNVNLPKDTDDDDIEIARPSSIDDFGFNLLSNGKGDFQIIVKGETINVPNDKVYTSIANDKSLKGADRAEKIYDEMKRYGDI